MVAGEDRARLLARARELLARAERGEVTYTPFLDPAEQHFLSLELAYARERWVLDGGYAAAERRRMLFLPDYVAEAGELREELLAPAREECLLALTVRGSGYRALTHRDFLGAVLHLGIARDAIGDLLVPDPYTCILFCDRTMLTFLCGELCRVASDAVTAKPLTLPPDFDGGRKFERLADTVPSPRADAVVAALCRLSRERAQALFRAGAVEVDFEPAEKPDLKVGEGTVLVVRGYGKFRICSLSDLTKKGRYRLLAERYL